MYQRLTIMLTKEQVQALIKMANDQIREPKMQLQYLLVQALREAGYLPRQNTIETEDILITRDQNQPRSTQ